MDTVLKLGMKRILALHFCLFSVGFADSYYCGYSHTYCSYGCCGSVCCLEDWEVALAVIGSLLLVAFFIGIICCMLSASQRPKRVVTPVSNTIVMQTSGQTMVQQQQQYGPFGYGPTAPPAYGPTPPSYIPAPPPYSAVGISSNIGSNPVGTSPPTSTYGGPAKVAL